ncbi:hypothetical protein SVEN_2337 [Streptomyces venezuelae ATCC 10712]|uniref:Uncharacterized protein n=1 Tax=Streptomyces venezuelae (strain ATCC 10712 / CBS 650.69 / DSM 40230 / JCM 4526 / NBRC 13096 / PD 04745) TaxID=953739 RepID=F2R274_STRVP|nr:hypothetical protein SVEN_2337 [Streptomyces venezuelae ATCC 10712]
MREIFRFIVVAFRGDRLMPQPSEDHGVLRQAIRVADAVGHGPSATPRSGTGG